MGEADGNGRWAPVPLSWNCSCRLQIHYPPANGRSRRLSGRATVARVRGKSLDSSQSRHEVTEIIQPRRHRDSLSLWLIPSVLSAPPRRLRGEPPPRRQIPRFSVSLCLCGLFSLCSPPPSVSITQEPPSSGGGASGVGHTIFAKPPRCSSSRPLPP